MKAKIIGAMLGALIGFASAASANVYDFTLPAGSTEAGGEPVSASADLVTSAGSIMLTRTNLLATPTSIAQLDHPNPLAGAATGPATRPHQTATFTFAARRGATADPVISDVIFSSRTEHRKIDAVPNVAVPIPAALWLFGSGLLGLVAIARRRQGRSARGLQAAA